MATKKITVTSLKRGLAAAEEANAKLTKQVEQEKSMKEIYSKNSAESKAEVESIHSLLDVLPNTIPRKSVPNTEEHWNVVTHSLMTRLASYLALRG
jgi:hypothetical protein